MSKEAVIKGILLGDKGDDDECSLGAWGTEIINSRSFSVTMVTKVVLQGVGSGGLF